MRIGTGELQHLDSANSGQSVALRRSDDGAGSAGEWFVHHLAFERDRSVALGSSLDRTRR